MMLVSDRLPPGQLSHGHGVLLAHRRGLRPQRESVCAKSWSPSLSQRPLTEPNRSGDGPALSPMEGNGLLRRFVRVWPTWLHSCAPAAAVALKVARIIAAHAPTTTIACLGPPDRTKGQQL